MNRYRVFVAFEFSNVLRVSRILDLDSSLDQVLSQWSPADMDDDITAPKGHTNIFTCAAGFALLNLPKGKSLGRSKPATNS